MYIYNCMDNTYSTGKEKKERTHKRTTMRIGVSVTMEYLMTLTTAHFYGFPTCKNFSNY